MEIARRLGIEGRLKQDKLGTSTVTLGSFPTWSYAGGIDAQIVDEEAEDNFFGEVFPFTPAFTDRSVLTVFGREDFFRAFILRFDEVPGILEIHER